MPRETDAITLDELRSLIATQTRAPEQRALAEQLLQEALALSHVPPAQRSAAILSIRGLDQRASDFCGRSLGNIALELVGDAAADPALKKVAYAEALFLAQWYASGASSGGEGTARSRHVLAMEAKLQALDRGR
ncbi:MAG: hypothetical protein ABIZ49_13885 [Opitutaceae bacterium]